MGLRGNEPLFAAGLDSTWPSIVSFGCGAWLQGVCTIRLRSVRSIGPFTGVYGREVWHSITPVFLFVNMLAACRSLYVTCLGGKSLENFGALKMDASKHEVGPTSRLCESMNSNPIFFFFQVILIWVFCSLKDFY